MLKAIRYMRETNSITVDNDKLITLNLDKINPNIGQIIKECSKVKANITWREVFECIVAGRIFLPNRADNADHVIYSNTCDHNGGKDFIMLTKSKDNTDSDIASIIICNKCNHVFMPLVTAINSDYKAVNARFYHGEDDVYVLTKDIFEGQDSQCFKIKTYDKGIDM